MADKKTVRQLINETAEATAKQVIKQLKKAEGKDYYKATEALLRVYPKLRKLNNDPSTYGFFPVDKSHDVTVAAPPGTMLDKVDVKELYVEARKRSFVRTMGRFTELEAVIQMFQHKPEFMVIRLAYFNEDIHGNDRGDGAKPYTWEEIADALDSIGITRSETVLRRWRSGLVKEMTVVLFGAEGALSVE